MGNMRLMKIYFIHSEALIEHDDYFDLYKLSKHKLYQDEMAVANKTEPVVINKMIRNPKKFKFTSVSRYLIPRLFSSYGKAITASKSCR
jgi:hypothetical protein